MRNPEQRLGGVRSGEGAHFFLTVEHGPSDQEHERKQLSSEPFAHTLTIPPRATEPWRQGYSLMDGTEAVGQKGHAQLG